MDLKIKKQLLMVLGAGSLVLLFIIIIIVVFFIQDSPKSPPDISVTPTPINVEDIPSPTLAASLKNNPQEIESGPRYKQSVEEIDKLNKQLLLREAAVGKLLGILPYAGEHFTLEYNIDKNQFTAYIDGDSGSREFDAFLKKNSVESRTWIRNLLINP
ncbi:MAG: hypothetical protein RLZZ455_573 [Candidatus Parcubacteria bacterium]|jgi:hypothetical protein